MYSSVTLILNTVKARPVHTRYYKSLLFFFFFFLISELAAIFQKLLLVLGDPLRIRQT